MRGLETSTSTFRSPLFWDLALLLSGAGSTAAAEVHLLGCRAAEQPLARRRLGGAPLTGEAQGAEPRGPAAAAGGGDATQRAAHAGRRGAAFF